MSLMAYELRRVKNLRYIAAGDVLIEVRCMHVKKRIEEGKFNPGQAVLCTWLTLFMMYKVHKMVINIREKELLNGFSN